MGQLAAYGVRFEGIGSGLSAPSFARTWPLWKVAQLVVATDDRPGMDIEELEARIGLPGVGEVMLDRRAREVRLRVREEFSAEAIVHPVLASAAVVIAHWMGRSTFHAAGVLIGARAWGILGSQGAGKSTTAALLVRHAGARLLTDDLLIVDGLTAFAGPPAIDLRADAAHELGGENLGIVGNRPRWRLEQPVAGESSELAGWIELAWGGKPSVAAADPIEGLRLVDHGTILPPRGENLLLAGSLPVLRFRRPRGLDGMTAGVELLAGMARTTSWRNDTQEK